MWGIHCMVGYIYTDGGVSVAQPRLYARIYPNVSRTPSNQSTVNLSYRVINQVKLMTGVISCSDAPLDAKWQSTPWWELGELFQWPASDSQFSNGFLYYCVTWVITMGLPLFALAGRNPLHSLQLAGKKEKKIWHLLITVGTWRLINTGPLLIPKNRTVLMWIYETVLSQTLSS